MVPVNGSSILALGTLAKSRFARYPDLMTTAKDSQDQELEGTYALILRDENTALRNKLLETNKELAALREKLAPIPPVFTHALPDETI